MTDLRKLFAKLKRAEKLKGEIAQARDELRDLITDLEAILDDVEGAEGEISDGLRALNDAADRMSHYL